MRTPTVFVFELLNFELGVPVGSESPSGDNVLRCALYG